jgi:hypothetical protein
MNIIKDKIQSRQKRNHRRVIVAVKQDGTPYKRANDIQRRTRELSNGAARRHGEKIVGKPCEYQTGINAMSGRFEKAARDLRQYRNTIANESWQRGNASKGYFEHMIQLTINVERRTTKDIISALRK